MKKKEKNKIANKWCKEHNGTLIKVCKNGFYYNAGSNKNIYTSYDECKLEKNKNIKRALFIKKWKNALPNDGIQILPHLYKANINFNPTNSYVLVNFSRSLLAKEYHFLLLSCLKASMTDYYEFKNQASPYITLEDFLPWGLCGLNIAIIYFSDSITTITNNQHWFAHRVGKGDIIVDRNGNLFLTDTLIMRN